MSAIPASIENAYRAAFYGRPGATFVDLPADLILANVEGEGGVGEVLGRVTEVPTPPKVAGDPERIRQLAGLLKKAKRPLIIIGKGACYARSEDVVRRLVERYTVMLQFKVRRC